jgi:hypothetical protein
MVPTLCGIGGGTNSSRACRGSIDFIDLVVALAAVVTTMTKIVTSGGRLRRSGAIKETRSGGPTAKNVPPRDATCAFETVASEVVMSRVNGQKTMKRRGSTRTDESLQCALRS